jgi:radical SAM protein with 4Fe4S-binding SPASM domain
MNDPTPPPAATLQGTVYERHAILRDPACANHLTHAGRSRPLFLICETINVCSNDCIICAYGHQNRQKGVMSMAIFEKVLGDYSALGGGLLSLTPMVGDIFLDRHLIERLERIEHYPAVRQVSVTTHATVADRYDDAQLRRIVSRFARLHISIYGLDAEEHRTLTRRDDHERTLASIRKLIAASDASERIALGFRTLRSYAEEDYHAWMRRELGAILPYTHINRYANWGGTFDTSKPLPMGAQWVEVRTNREQCLIPLLALQVFVNGDVSFCPCCDFDANSELALGNIRESDLGQLYNSERCRQLWDFEGGHMPRFCRNCSFHMPLASLRDHRYVFEDPFRFFGG